QRVRAPRRPHRHTAGHGAFHLAHPGVRWGEPVPHPLSHSLFVVPPEPLEIRPQHHGPQLGHRLDVRHRSRPKLLVHHDRDVIAPVPADPGPSYYANRTIDRFADGPMARSGTQRSAALERSKPRSRIPRSTWAFALRAGDGNRTRAVSLGS